MGLYSENKHYKLYLGKMQDELKNIDSNSIDSIVTDPPYELNFMNKGWDNSGVAFQKETWQECFRVLKPGGYLLAFGGSRTFHRIAVAIEDAGFEIRDTIMWLYGSGFPKSMNVAKSIESKIINGNASNTKWKTLDGTKVESGNWGLNKSGFEYGYRPADYSEDKHLRVDKVNYQSEEAKKWDGWGTCLKPAYEPIIMARKPLEGSCTDNILKYGVGGINIDECRVGSDYISGGTAPDLRDVGKKQKEISGIDKLSFGQISNAERIPYEGHYGRFPANIITDGSSEVSEGMPYTKSTGGSGESSIKSGLSGAVYQGGWKHDTAGANIGGLGDEGNAVRYFKQCEFSSKDNEQLFKIQGRFPSNIITDGSEEVAEGMPITKSTQSVGVKRNERADDTVFSSNNCGLNNSIYDSNKVEGYDDNGSAMRYFYCAKASKKDRDEGLSGFDEKFVLIDGVSEEIKNSIKTLLNQPN